MPAQTLFDTLAGAAGHPVNRPSLDAYVTQGQAMSGLRTAQTDEALTKAQAAQEEMKARDDLETALGDIMGSPAEAHVAATVIRSNAGNASVALDSLLKNTELKNRQKLSDPNQLGTPGQTAAQQGIEGKVAGPVTVPQEFTTLPGGFQPHVQQTPEGAARTELLGAQSTANVAKANKDNASASTAGTGMSDDALYNAAVRYNMTGSLPSLGMNSGADRRKILEYAAKISVVPDWQPDSWSTPPAGAPPAQPGVVPTGTTPPRPTPATAMAPIGAAANTKANGAMLTDITKRAAMVDASEKTANDNLLLAQNMLKATDQTGSPLINAVYNKIASGIFGDPDVSAWTNALTTASNEYARVVSMATGAAGITDAARSEGERLFNSNLGPQQIAKNIKVAQQEMANRSSSLHGQINNAKTAITTPPAGSTPAPAAPAAAAPAAAAPAHAVSLDEYLKRQGF